MPYCRFYRNKELGTSKHYGAISLFDLEFIKSGIFDKELSKTLHRAFELRQKSDYMEQAEVTKNDVALCEQVVDVDSECYRCYGSNKDT